MSYIFRLSMTSQNDSYSKITSNRPVYYHSNAVIEVYLKRNPIYYLIKVFEKLTTLHKRQTLLTFLPDLL